jgi:endonuclease/exonuclease/phosphatase family metal-dependent hydrolase
MRIVTLNLWGQRNWEQRRPLIQSLLDSQRQGNYIFCFQEVVSRQHLGDLASQGEHYEFLPARTNPTEGIGFISNLKPTKVENFMLTRDPADSDDKYQRNAAVVQLPNGLIIANTHLAISAAAQLSAVKELLAELQAKWQAPKQAIVGDFNCAPGEDAYTACLTAGFADSWLKLGEQEFASWPVDIELIKRQHLAEKGSLPQWEIAPRRMDYILQRGLTAQAVQKLGTVEQGVWHSDHWGVAINFA